MVILILHQYAGVGGNTVERIYDTMSTKVCISLYTLFVHPLFNGNCNWRQTMLKNMNDSHGDQFWLFVALPQRSMWLNHWRMTILCSHSDQHHVEPPLAIVADDIIISTTASQPVWENGHQFSWIWILIIASLLWVEVICCKITNVIRNIM